MAERQFSESQVADIIRRAAENQSRLGKTLSHPSFAISETEVRRIAQELGIDPGALQQALDDEGTWKSSETGTIRSVERTLERVFDAELPEESYSILVDEFVPTYTLTNPALKIGSALNYTAMVGIAQCSISVARRNAKTTLKVRSNASVAVLPTFLPALIATAVSGAIVWDGMTAAALVKAVLHIAISVAIWTGAWVGFRTLVRNSNLKVLELLDRASAALSESVAGPRSELGRGTSDASLEETRPERGLQQGR